MKTRCLECGDNFTANGGRGRTPTYCSPACRQRDYRNRKARLDRFMILAAGRWVRADGKRPIQADGTPASSTNPSTWASHTAVVSSSAGDGIGVLLGGGLAAHDLDDCFDGKRLKPWARHILDSIDAPLFVERSVSGNGLHIFVEADEGRGTRKRMPGGGGHEFYRTARFIRTTFDTFS